MPRRAKGPRLYLDKNRQQWVIRDGTDFHRTGAAAGDIARAEQQLADYIASKHRPQPSPAPLIADILEAYARDAVPELRSARSVRYNLGSLARWWGAKRSTEITARNCRAYAATKTSSAALADLKVLQRALRHWESEYSPLNPRPSIWKPKPGPARDRWLTRTEAAALLRAARRTPYLARMILLGLYTGSRPGVIKALEWSWLDLDARIMHRRPPGAAQAQNKRSPPVRLGRRILAHLRRWQKQDSHIPWVVHYDGRPIDDPHGSWKRAITKAGLTGVTPHTLRHTRATWLMQEGIDPWEAAGALGMSVRVLEAVYGHHHPAWQKRAAEV